MGKSSSGRPRAGSEISAPSEKRRDSKRDSTTSSRRKSSRRDDYVDERDDATATSSRAAPSTYVTAFTAEPSPIDAAQDTSIRYNDRDRYDDARGHRDDRHSKYRSSRGDVENDARKSKSERENDRDRRDSRRSGQSDQSAGARAPTNRDPSLPQNLFPGEMPSTYTQPYRPPGQASSYYGDQGESVSFQPGVRPNQPSIVTNAEQAHLMEPTVDPRPPAEPSSLGQVGAAAGYFGNTGMSNDSGFQSTPSKPSQRLDHNRPDQPGGLGASPRASPSHGDYPDRPMQQFAAGGSQFASSAAAEYYSGSAFQTPPRLPQPSFDGSGPYSAPAGTGVPFANSNIPLYGAAGVAAGAAYLHHHQNNHHSHGSSGPGNAGPYSSGPTQMQQRHEHKHKHRSPLGKFVDWFRDPKAVAEYEQYTEAIGVCKYCFDPMSSPADAPRRHHYRPKRTSSGSRYGSSTRVDKTYRYSSDEERKRRSGVKKVVAGGLAGYGAAKVGNAILKANHDFDDTYSVKSGRPFAASRVSFQGEETTSTSKSKQRYSSTEDLRESHEKRRESQFSETTRRRDKHRSRRRDSSSSSSSRGLSRGAALSTGIGAAGLAVGAAALNNKLRRDSRDRSRSRSPPSRKKYYSKRVSPMHSYVDLSTTNSGPTGLVGFFTSPSANKKKGKKPKGLFTFSNGSSSSSDADLAYGAGTVRRKRSIRRLSGSNDRSKQYASAAGMMGLVKLGNDLASESDRRKSKGKRSSDAHSKVGIDARHSNNGFYMQDQAQPTAIGQDEEWYDTDDSDGGLVYGSGTSTLPRREPHPQPARYPSDHYQRAQAIVMNESSRRQSASYNQSQNADAGTFVSSFESKGPAPSMGYMGKPPPMQELEPRPISNNGPFDDRPARHDSYHNGERYQTSNSVPLHQPQPVPIIPFINQSVDASPSQDMGSTDYRRTKPLLEDLRSNRNIGTQPSDNRSSRRSRRDSSPAKLLSQDSKNNVSFDLSNEQLESERQSSKKDPARDSRREKKDRRKSADAALVMGAGALIAGALVKDQMSDKRKSSDSVRDTPSQPSTREAEIDRQLQALYDEKRRQEERKRTLEQLEQANRSATSEESVIPKEPVKRSSSSEDSSRPRRKSSLKKNKAREASPASDTQQERIARMAAQRVKSTPSPVYEDYGNFFVPQELVEHLKEHNEKAEHRDDVHANVVEIVPGASKSNRRNPFDPFLYRPFGLDVDDDPSLHPWPVPMLGLVEPTPPGSRAHSDRGDVTPVARPTSVEPPHDEGEPLERKASNGSKVTWGDHDTYVYEVQTPEYERSDYMPDHKESSREGGSKQEEPKMSYSEESAEPRPKVGRTWTLDDSEAEVLERELPSVSDRPHVSRAWTVDDKEADKIEHPAKSSHSDVLNDMTPHVIEIKPRQTEASLPHDMKPALDDDDRNSPPTKNNDEPLREVYQSPFAETVSDLGLSNDQRHLPDSPDGRLQLGLSDLQNKPQDTDTDFPDVRQSKSEQRRRERASSSSEPPDEQSIPSTEPPNTIGPSDRESVFDFLVDDDGKSVASTAAVGLGAATILATHPSSKEPSQQASDRDTVRDDDIVRDRAGVKRSSTFDDAKSQRQLHSSSKSDPQSDPEDWERSRASKKDKGSKRSAQSDVGISGNGSNRSRDEATPVFEKPRRSHTESEVGDDYDTKSSASGRKRKSKRSERSNGQSREDSTSRAGFDDEKPRRKSKRDSQIFDDGYAQSVVSSPAEMDKHSKEKDKKSSGGFFSNIFSSNKSDVSTSSKRSSKSSKSESRADRSREEGSESRRKHRSKDRDLDDAASAVSEPLRSSRQSSERSRRDKSEKTSSRDESLDDGFVSAEEPTEAPALDDEDGKSFLGKRPEMPQPTDIAMPMDTDGVSGLASGRTSPEEPRAIDELSPKTRTSDNVEGPVTRDLNMEGDLVLPSKPSTARRRLSAIQTREPDSSPTTPGYPTATSVPVHFRIPASSPIAPRFSMSSPIASPASPLTTPRTRQGRPKSTEFAGKNIRPLYLVEASNPSKIALPDTSDYPPLPPSIASSSHPSTEDLRAEAQAQEQPELFTPSRLSADQFRDQARRQSYSYWHDGEERRRSPDYLDSRSATPVPGEAQRARDRENKPKPKYEFHSPSELLQDPSLLYGDEDMEHGRPGSPLPSVVSTDLDYMSARSRSLSPPTRARSLSRGRRSASGSRSTSVSWQDAVSTVATGALVGSALGFVAHETLNESSPTVHERDESTAGKHLDTYSAGRGTHGDTASRERPAEKELEVSDLPAKTPARIQDEPLDQDTEVEIPYSDADTGTADVAIKSSKKTKKDKKKQKRKQSTPTFSDDMLPSAADPAQISSEKPESSSLSDPMSRDLQTSESHEEVQDTAKDLSANVDQSLEGIGSSSIIDQVDYFQDQSVNEDVSAPSLSQFDDPSSKEDSRFSGQSPDQKPNTELSPFEQALEAAVQARGLSQGTTMEVAHDAFLPEAPSELPDNGGTPLTAIEEENEPITPGMQTSKVVPERKNSRKSKRKDPTALEWGPASENSDPVIDAPQPSSPDVQASFEHTQSDQPKYTAPEGFVQEQDSIPNPFGNDFVVTDADIVTLNLPSTDIPDSSSSTNLPVVDTPSSGGPTHDPETVEEIEDWSAPITKKGKNGKKDKKGKKRQSLSWEEPAESATPTESQPPSVDVPNPEQAFTNVKQVSAESHSADSTQATLEQASTQNEQARVVDTSVQNQDVDQEQLLGNADDPWDTGAKKTKKTKKGKRKSLTWADEENLTSFAETSTEKALADATDPVPDDTQLFASQPEQPVVPASQGTEINVEQPKEIQEESGALPPSSTKIESQITPEDSEFKDSPSAKSTRKSKKKQKNRDSDGLVAAAAVSAGAVGALALGSLHADMPDTEKAAGPTTEGATVRDEDFASASGLYTSVRDSPIRDDEGTTLQDLPRSSKLDEASFSSPPHIPSSVQDESPEAIQSLASAMPLEAESIETPEEQDPEDFFSAVGKKSKKDKKKKRQSTFDEPTSVIEASDSTPQSLQLQNPECAQTETQEAAEDVGFPDTKKSKKDKKKKRQSVFEPDAYVFEDAVSGITPNNAPIEREAKAETDSSQRSLESQDLGLRQEEPKEVPDSLGFVDKKKAKKDKKIERQTAFDEPDMNVYDRVVPVPKVGSESIDEVDDKQTGESSTLPIATETPEKVEDSEFVEKEKEKSKKDEKKKRLLTFDEPDTAGEAVATPVVESESIKIPDITATAEANTLPTGNEDENEDSGFVEKKKSKKDKKKKRQSTFDDFQTPPETNAPFEAIATMPTEESAGLTTVSKTNTADSGPLAFDDGVAPTGKQSKKDKKKKRASALQFASPEQQPTFTDINDFRAPGAFDLDDTATLPSEEPQTFQPEHRSEDDHPLPEDRAFVNSADEPKAVEPSVVETPTVEPFPEAPVEETPTKAPAFDSVTDVTVAPQGLKDVDDSRKIGHSVVDTPSVEIPADVPGLDDVQEHGAATEICGEQKPSIEGSDIATIPIGLSETEQRGVGVSTNELPATGDKLAGHEDLDDAAQDEWEPTPKKSKKDKKKKKQNLLDDHSKDATILEGESSAIAKDSTSETTLPPVPDQSSLLDIATIAAPVAVASHDNLVEGDEWNPSAKKDKKDKKKKRQSVLTSPPTEPVVPENETADRPADFSADQPIPTEVDFPEVPTDGDSHERPAAEADEWGYSSKRDKKDKKKKRQSLFSTPLNEQDVSISDAIGKSDELPVEPTMATSSEPLDASVDRTIEEGSQDQPDIAEEGDWGFTSNKAKKDKKKKRKSLFTTPPNEPDPAPVDDSGHVIGALPADSERSQDPTVAELSEEPAVQRESAPEPEWGYSTKKSKDKKKRRSGFEDPVLDNNTTDPDATATATQNPAQNLDETVQITDPVEQTRGLMAEALFTEPDAVPDQSPASQADAWPMKSKKSKKDKKKSKATTDPTQFENDQLSTTAESSVVDTSKGPEELVQDNDLVADAGRNAIQIAEISEPSIESGSSAPENHPTTDLGPANLPIDASVEDTFLQPDSNKAQTDRAAEQEIVPTDGMHSPPIRKTKKDKKKKRQSTFDDASNEPESTLPIAPARAIDGDFPVSPAEPDIPNPTTHEAVGDIEASEAQIAETDEHGTVSVGLTKTSAKNASLEEASAAQPSQGDGEATVKSIPLANTVDQSVKEPVIAPQEVIIDTQPTESTSTEIQADAAVDNSFTIPSAKSKKDKKKKRMSTFDDAFEDAVDKHPTSTDIAFDDNPTVVLGEAEQEPADTPKDIDIGTQSTESATRDIEPYTEPDFTIPSKKSKKDKKKKRMSVFDDTFEDAVQESTASQDVTAVDVQPGELASMETEAEAEFPTVMKNSKKDRKKNKISVFDDTFEGSFQEPVTVSEDAVTGTEPVEPMIATENPDEFEVPSKKSKKDRKKKRTSAFDDFVDEPTRDQETLVEVLAGDAQATNAILTDEPAKDGEITTKTAEVFSNNAESAEPNTTDEAAVNPEVDVETFFTSSKKSKKDKKKKTSTFDDMVEESAEPVATPELTNVDMQFTEPSKTVNPTTMIEPEQEEFVTPGKKSKKDKKKKRMSTFDDLVDEPRDQVTAPEVLKTDPMETITTTEPIISVEPEEGDIMTSKISKKDKKDKKKKRTSNFGEIADEPEGEGSTRLILDTDGPLADPDMVAEKEFAESSKKSRKDKKKKRQSPFDDAFDEPEQVEAPEVRESDALSAEPALLAEAGAKDQLNETSKQSKKDKKKKNQPTFDDIIDEPARDIIVDTPEGSVTDPQPAEPTIAPEASEELTIPSKKSRKKKRQSTFDEVFNEPGQDLIPASAEILTPNEQLVEPTVTAKEEDEEDFVFSSKKSKKDKKKKRQSTYEEKPPTEQELLPSDLQESESQPMQGVEFQSTSSDGQAMDVDAPGLIVAERELSPSPSAPAWLSGPDNEKAEKSFDLVDKNIQSPAAEVAMADLEQAGEGFDRPALKGSKGSEQVESEQPSGATPITDIPHPQEQEPEPARDATTVESRDLNDTEIAQHDWDFSSKKSKKDKKKRQSTLNEPVTIPPEDATLTISDSAPSAAVTETRADAEPDWGFSSKKSKKDREKRQSTVDTMGANPYQDDAFTPQTDVTMNDAIDTPDTQSEPVASTQDQDQLELVARDNESNIFTTADPPQHEASTDLGFEVPQKKSKKDKTKNRQSKAAEIDLEEPQSEEVGDKAVNEASQKPREIVQAGMDTTLASPTEKTMFEQSRHIEQPDVLDQTEGNERRPSLTVPAILNNESNQETETAALDSSGTILGAVAAAGAAAVLASELPNPSKKSKKDKKKKRQSTLDEDAFGTASPFEGPSSGEPSFKDDPNYDVTMQESGLKDVPDENVSIQSTGPTENWGISGEKSKKSKKKTNLNDLGDDFQTPGTGTPRSTDHFDTAVQTPLDQPGMTSFDMQDPVVVTDLVAEPSTEGHFPTIDRKTSKKDKRKKKTSSPWVDAVSQDLAVSQGVAASHLEAKDFQGEPKVESHGLEDSSRIAQHDDGYPLILADRMDTNATDGPMIRDDEDKTHQQEPQLSRSPEPYQSTQHEDYGSSTQTDYVDPTENYLAVDTETMPDKDLGNLAQTEPMPITVEETTAPRRAKSKKEKRIFEFNGTENINPPPVQTEAEHIYGDSAAIPTDDQVVDLADRSIEPSKSSDHQGHSDQENLSDVSASTRERRKRRRSPPLWAGEEPDDLPRNRSMTPPPEHDDLMDTALGVAAGLGFGAAGHEPTRSVRPRSNSPVRKQSTGWSFAKLGTGVDLGNADSNRDSGVQFESPVLPIDQFPSTRDSGFVAEPSERSRGGGTDPGLDMSLRPPRPQSPTSSTEDVSKKRRSKSRKDDISTLETPRRRPSPVDSTSKERSSVLFNSSPAVPTPLKTSTAPISPEPVSSPLRRSPSIHGHHHSREELKQKGRISHNYDSNDALASNLLDRSAKAEIHRDAFSPGPEGSARFGGNRMSLNTIREDAVDSSGSTRDQHPFSNPPLPLTPQARGSKDNLAADAGLAAAAVGAVGLTALALSKTTSRDSESGHAKSLGRSKSRTSSLRNLRANAASPYDAINAAAGPSHIPVNETDLEGSGSRNRDMSDVYVSTSSCYPFPPTRLELGH